MEIKRILRYIKRVKNSSYDPLYTDDFLFPEKIVMSLVKQLYF